MNNAKTSQACLQIEKDIILGENLSYSRNKALKEHLKSCPACRAFAEVQANMKGRLTAEQSVQLPPERILQHLQLHMANRPRGKSVTAWRRLRQLLGFRIRLDHAMAAVIVVIGFVWGLARLHTIFPLKSAKPIKSQTDQSVIETAQATLLLHTIAGQKLGRPITEDSLYSRFTFTM